MKRAERKHPHAMTELFAEVSEACDKYMKNFRENPPNVTGYLSLGIDKERMQKIADEWSINYKPKLQKE